jgi:hypothetical protein
MTPYGGIMELPFYLRERSASSVRSRTISPLLRVLNGEECIVENVIIGGLEKNLRQSLLLQRTAHATQNRTYTLTSSSATIYQFHFFTRKYLYTAANQWKIENLSSVVLFGETALVNHSSCSLIQFYSNVENVLKKRDASRNIVFNHYQNHFFI